MIFEIDDNDSNTNVIQYNPTLKRLEYKRNNGLTTIWNSVYMPGDTISLANTLVNGHISNGNCDLYLQIPLSNSVGANNVSIISMNANIRQAGKYLFNDSHSSSGANLLSGVTRSGAAINNIGIICSLSYPSAIRNSINNDLVTIEIVSGTIAFT